MFPELLLGICGSFDPHNFNLAQVFASRFPDQVLPFLYRSKPLETGFAPEQFGYAALSRVAWIRNQHLNATWVLESHA